jgi:hypothetical protein
MTRRQILDSDLIGFRTRFAYPYHPEMSVLFVAADTDDCTGLKLMIKLTKPSSLRADVVGIGELEKG